jgi:hypothetical protein
VKRVFVILAAGLLLSACGPVSHSLYYWGSSSDGATEYERKAYRLSATQSPESLCAMMMMYEELINAPGGSRQIPPPGICAEYAWLLAQPETADIFAKHATSRQKAVFNFTDYASGFLGRSRELFEREMRYYPESIVFIKPLAERLSR